MSVEYFEELYRADPDPWDLATSDYERGKHVATIGALDGRRPARAAELGCSIGVLTARLAAVCGELLAIDAAPSAVERARERTAGLPNVTVARGSIPDDVPAGPLDLVVCSEVLYYGDAAWLEETWRRVRAALAPGGSALAVHWRGPVRHYPLSGDAVHARLRARCEGLVHARSEDHPRFLLDRFDRP